MNEIIPFGKYKNQPIEVLASDKQYTEWLCQQSWFINQFNQLHTIIINNFNQPAETPEHNLFVANFLDDSICEKIFLKRKNWQEVMIRDIEFKAKYNGCSDELLESAKAGFFKIKVDIKDKTFECRSGSDIHIIGELFAVFKKEKKELFIGCENLWVECKPVIGDDYPTIIRQCKNQHSNVLVFGKFQSESITKDQFMQMFKNLQIIQFDSLTK